MFKYGLEHDSYLLVVGNMDPRKNLHRLAAAFGKLTEEQRAATPLVIVGGGADIYRQADIEWPVGTVLTGYVDDEALSALYAHCRATVFPSLAEGFGLPIVEAAVAGAARLLVSDIPVFRWICGDGAEYVDSTSIEALVAALQPDRIDAIRPPETLLKTRFSWDHSAAIVGRAATKISCG